MTSLRPFAYYNSPQKLAASRRRRGTRRGPRNRAPRDEIMIWYLRSSHRCAAACRLAQAETYHHRRHRCSGTSLGPSRCRADAIGDVARAETVFLADASPRVQEAPGDALDLQRATHRSRGRRRGLPGRGAAGIRAGPRANDLSCCGPRARRGAARRRSSAIGCGEVLRAPGRWSRPPRAAESPRGALESDTNDTNYQNTHKSSPN